MIRNYFKIAWRDLIKNKGYALINISGLALSVAAFIFILEYIGLEKGVNQFHSNVDHIYRVMNVDRQGESWPEVAPGWADLMKNRFAEIEDYCRFEKGIATGVVQNPENQTSYREENIGYAEGNFFRFFSFPLVKGQAANLNEPYTLFLSESTARKYFGDQDPIDKTLVLHNQFGKVEYIVKGVYADMDHSSDIEYDMVFSLETLQNPANLNGNDWASLDNIDSQYLQLFLLLKDNSPHLELEQKLNALRNELSKENDGIRVRLQPMKNMHLAASLNSELQTYGNLKYIYILSGVALLILLIAWFNYVNLTTAASLKRAGDVGMRKAIGATKTQIVKQFLFETALLNTISFTLALLLVVILQPSFNSLIGKEASLLNLGNSYTWLLGVSLLLAGSTASGVYTALMLSDFNPTEVLKGKLSHSNKGVFIRKGLVISQFAISAILIFATIVIYRQLQFMQNRDLGINTEQMLVIHGPEIGLNDTYNERKSSFSNYLDQQSFVLAHTSSGSVPGKFYNFKTSGFTHPGSKPDDEYKSYSFVIIGENYLSTYQIPLVEGRNFTAVECNVNWNDNSKVLINEQAVRSMGFSSAQQAIATGIQWDERHLDIIGVVEDYHHISLHSAIDPVIFYPQSNNNYYSVRLTSENLSSKIEMLKSQFEKFFPGNPFEYSFADEAFAKAYAEERQYSRIFSAASALAIFIACMGLFGLVTFMVETRTKEIGVRKTLGAGVGSVLRLLSFDFLKLVIIASIIGAPVAWYAMDEWLKSFAYRISIEWWVFGLVALLVIAIAFLTIAYQSIKAALTNPVKSLRTE